ncbi:MAG TPA: methyl-accepting chemotaxis protein [Negativicutes bacterium]|nr:methyl-accepting chemotaxis protein [Negativicutes bacterium]
MVDILSTNTMKIGTKIFAGFLAVVFLMIISGGVSIYLLRDISKSSDVTQEERIPLLLKTNLLAVNGGLKTAAMRGFVITGNDSFLADYNKMDKEDDTTIQYLVDKAVTAQGKQMALDVKKLDDAYQKIAFEKVVPLKRAGKTDEVIAVMANELAPAASATRAKMDEYIKFREKQINDTLDADQALMSKAQWIITVFLVVALVCATGIAFYITQSVRKPLNAATHRLGVMAGGDYSAEIEAAFLKRSDEFGTMAQAFDKLNRGMRSIIKQVTASSEQVAASAEQLTASAQQSAEASGSIAASIQQVANGSEKQVAAVNETSAIVQEISATMEEVSATASEMANMSEQTAKAALTGKESVDRAVTQMGEVSVGAKQAQSAAEELKVSSAQIGEIVGLISTIAGQTNLLALNAAIEAARAGEQGRGFAVVAEEVRKLAEQSEQAAHQIKTLVGSNHTSIGNVVGAIDVAIQNITEGVELVNVAGTNFGEINNKIGQVTEQVHIIAKAISEAAIGSQRIVSSIKDVESISRDAAAETQTVSAATEEQSASMEEIAASSQALSKLAIDLQGIIAKFRI